MALKDDICGKLKAAGLTVSEWLISDGGRAIKPPYACVCDVEGHGVYADGKCVIPIDTVKVHVVYTPASEDFLQRVTDTLREYGTEWIKEKFSAERVMICTLTIEGG